MPTINQLTPVTTPATTDVFPSQQVGGATVSQTPAQIVSTQRNVPNGVAGIDANGNLVSSGVVTQAASGSSPTTGSTVTIPNNVKTYSVRGAATLASLTIDLPLQPVDNQDLVIVFQVAVTSLTITPGAGYTSNLPIAGVAIQAGSRIVYNLDGTVWC